MRARSVLVMGASLWLAWTSQALAVSESDQVTQEEWDQALAVAGVPSEVLYAMGVQESGTTFGGQRRLAPWPWVLNVNGKGRYFRTRAEAQAALDDEVAKGNQRVAVGMLQIYLKYNGHRVDDPRSLLAPTVNLRVAAEVLQDCGKGYPDVFDKVACYYSGDTDEAGIWYAAEVFKRAGLAVPRGIRVPASRPGEGTKRSRLPPYMVAVNGTPKVSAWDEGFLHRISRSDSGDDRVIVIEGATP